MGGRRGEERGASQGWRCVCVCARSEAAKTEKWNGQLFLKRMFEFFVILKINGRPRNLWYLRVGLNGRLY